MDFEPLTQMIAESESAHRDAIEQMASMFETERVDREINIYLGDEVKAIP